MKSNLKINYLELLNESKVLRKVLPRDQKHLNIDIDTKKLKNVFVNHYGLVIKNNLLVSGCAPNIKFGYDSNFYYKHWRKAIEQKIVSKYGKSIESKVLDESKNYLLIHSPWFSYYFWITECLPRLLSVKSELDNYTLIYPEGFDNYPFVKETLGLFKNLKIERIKKDLHMFVPKLTLPEVKPWTILFIPEQIKLVRDFLIPYANSLSKTKYLPERICITREGTHRSFEDYKLVKDILNKYNFVTIKMEEYSFFEQIQLMQNAKCVMGISGAGHTNIHFMSEGASFMDITAYKNIKTKKYKLHFYKLACIVGVNYLLQYAENVKKVGVPYYNQNIRFDYNEFENNIKLMINE